MRERPRFYNTLTTNCTTMILDHSAVNLGHLPYS
ncbi:MAG: lipoprotein N-acyltransferase Lnb domain-containing protein [Methylosarcina sp.]